MTATDTTTGRTGTTGTTAATTTATPTADTSAPADDGVPAVASDPDEFAERVFAAILGAQEVQAVYLGDKLGWYRALATGGALTSTELAEATDTDERYAREWLEHQATAAYVTVDRLDASPTERRYALPAAHATVLTDEDSLAFAAPFARFVAGAGRLIDRFAEAYRTGGGISWDEMGDGAREAQADANRPLFLHALGQDLLPAAPEVHEHLLRASRLADVGCGYGWSSIGLATAYPDATVDGYDVDAPSVERARRHATDAGLADRVRFTAVDAGEAGTSDLDGSYDAVFAFECIHDMSDPVSALARMRRLVAEDGIVVVMDERAEERFVAPAGPTERMLYGFSLMCCLADGLSHEPSVGTGTVMRPDTLARYARRAGFTGIDVLPIEHDSYRFYRLVF